ncbi:hypothetical protein GUJ93_ZPchr0003g18407 [Zizania palustris]|uniref:Uncharacterized protein n=1 Tax=Zizania palustris TaxID=103762 RepID=A0A8J5S3A1_ZIZPA|nr:hypothetical protein GUJ93_ZPchr0003g18407 [Zizania palustris]
MEAALLLAGAQPTQGGWAKALQPMTWSGARGADDGAAARLTVISSPRDSAATPCRRQAPPCPCPVPSSRGHAVGRVNEWAESWKLRGSACHADCVDRAGL